MSDKPYISITACNGNGGEIRTLGTFEEIVGLLCEGIYHIAVHAGVSPVKLAANMVEVITEVEEDSNLEA